MGAVYEGEQSLGTAKRKVAVKTLHAHLSRDPKVQARFEREVATISELEHPNTIQVYDFGATADGILYFVMEFLHGGSVADQLALHGAMAPHRACHIVDQVCGSLEEAHGRGIVHRDLKPDNVVLVERAGHKDFVKVLDFGIAKRMGAPDTDESRLTQQGMVVGTPPYMSPEQFAGREIDARSDIYSLGVMAYEMLTGKLPFKANTAWEWAAQHLTAPPIPIESLAQGMQVPQSMRAAILRALAKSPDDRFQNVRSFLDAFAGADGAPAPETVSERVLAGKTELAAPGAIAPLGESASLAKRPVAAAGLPPPTATAGNMAFPTPAPAADVAPARPRRRRGLLLALAGVIGTGSALAIAFALKGEPRRDGVRNPNQSPEPAYTAVPATSIAPADLSATEVLGPTQNPGSDIPPLTAGDEKPIHSPQSGQRSSSGSSASSPTVHTPGADGPQGPGSVGAGASSLTSLPPRESPPPAPNASSAQLGAPTKYDGPECQKARILRAFGRNREARSWTLACLAKGGSL